jgi:prolyl-tRNA synthetase
MRQSKLFAKIKKESPKGAESISHQFLARADFIDQLASGVYTFLPLGQRVHKKIENIIRKEMVALGGEEVSLPTLVPKNLWQETGRWQTIDPPLFKVKDRHGAEFGLGSTHEEVVTHHVRQRIKSYKDLPFSLFQIQDKFRNELRATGGLLRVREFVMKDLYSFHATREDAIRFYQKIKKAYFRIFKHCGLKTIYVEADPGTIGGELSHEFMVFSPTGEDKVLICQKCGCAGNIEKFKNIKFCPKCRSPLKKFSSVESAHAFYLGTKYSKAMGASFIDKKGRALPIIMGCYGIGLGRLMATIVEVNHDTRGIIWPKEVAPFHVHLIQIENNRRVKKIAERVYQNLQKSGIGVLYDDREEKTVGEKFAEADLIGIPLRLVVSEKTLKKNSVELKKRSEQKTKLVKISQLKKYVQ